jgi:5-methylcytosine-specific restriction enzyme A
MDEEGTMQRNPPWTRDELILALDLYFRVNFVHPGNCDKEVAELSSLLNELPIHSERPDTARFRNPNGVRMKLSNFLRLDPAYGGAGLSRGGHLEEVVWSEFANHRDALSRTAAAIRRNRNSISAPEVDADAPLSDSVFPEGRLLTALHRRRERNTKVVARKKRQVMGQHGRLECEACGFDFEAVYGDLGHGYAECHHTIPLSSLGGQGATRLSDLAIVCANCHRMIHRSHPMLTVSDLSRVVHSEVVAI